jgi:hypothetical protein
MDLSSSPMYCWPQTVQKFGAGGFTVFCLPEKMLIKTYISGTSGYCQSYGYCRSSPVDVFQDVIPCGLVAG